MVNALGKYWPLISIALFLVLLAGLFFWPTQARPISQGILALSILLAVAFTSLKHWEAYQAGRLNRTQLARGLSLELLGLFLTMAVAMLAGSLASNWVAARLGPWPGLLAALLAAGLAGFLSALGLRRLWGILIAA